MYSKSKYRKGNFIKYNNQLHLIFSIDDTIIGSVLTIISCDENKNIYRILEEKVQPYNRKPNGLKPASEMSEKQRKCIQTIEKVLNVQFNGKKLDDVSIFIGYFIEASTTKSYTDEQFELSKYDGLSWTDLMM